jgi:hypothetical protein
MNAITKTTPKEIAAANNPSGEPDRNAWIREATPVPISPMAARPGSADSLGRGTFGSFISQGGLILVWETLRLPVLKLPKSHCKIPPTSPGWQGKKQRSCGRLTMKQQPQSATSYRSGTASWEAHRDCIGWLRLDSSGTRSARRPGPLPPGTTPRRCCCR